MKTKNALFITAIYAMLSMAIPAFIAAPVLTGCSTPEQTAYRSIGSIAATVDGAMQGWGEWVRAGRATDGQQAQVRKAYGEYQAVMRVARVAAMAAKDYPAGEASYTAAIAAVSASADDLVSLLDSFGVLSARKQLGR